VTTTVGNGRPSHDEHRLPGRQTYAERFVLTARLEITDVTVISGEPYLRRILAGYVGRDGRG
jgi:hypothetical protein